MSDDGHAPLGDAAVPAEPGALSDAPSPRSDAELIAAVRGGETAAYGELYERHLGAANALARQLASSRSTADDLVAEAFARVLETLQQGRGPDVAFRAYLLTTLRNCLYDHTRRDRRLQFSDDLSSVDPGDPFVDTPIAQLESSMVARAYASLPERWQTILWHTEIEGEKPADVAPLLGLTANGAAALAYRAREGLRQAYLQAHLAETTENDDCRYTVERLGAYARGGLSKRESSRVENHLAEHDECRALAAELTDINSGLRAFVAPLVLGLPFAAAYIAAQTAGAAGAVGAAAAAASAGSGVGGSAAGVGSGVGSGIGSGATAGSAGSGAAASNAAGSAAGSGGSGGAGAGGAASSGVGGISLGAGIAAAVAGIVIVGGIAFGLTRGGDSTPQGLLSQSATAQGTSTQGASAQPSASSGAASGGATTAAAPGSSSSPAATSTPDATNSAAPSTSAGGNTAPTPAASPPAASSGAGSRAPDAAPTPSTPAPPVPTPAAGTPMTVAVALTVDGLSAGSSGPLTGRVASNPQVRVSGVPADWIIQLSGPCAESSPTTVCTLPGGGGSASVMVSITRGSEASAQAVIGLYADPAATSPVDTR